MRTLLLRQLADYGGALNAALCAVHCAAGPLLFAWWGAHEPDAAAAQWEPVFLLLSGVLVALATRPQTPARLRAALWGLFGVFAAAALLAGRWPALEYVQYAASAGLLLTHLLNQRHCRRCAPVALQTKKTPCA